MSNRSVSTDPVVIAAKPTTGRKVTVYVADKTAPESRAITFVSTTKIRGSVGLGKNAIKAVRKRLHQSGALRTRLKNERNKP